MLDPVQIAYSAPGIIIGLSFHEFAHALVAYYYGDDTAKQHGRLSINPMAHLDVLGTIAILFAGLGWAKPVPVNPHNYKGNKKIADIVVSLAGPLTNLFLSIISIIILKLLISFNVSEIILGITWRIVNINVVLFIFNLIPVPPLDGSHILYNILPPGKRDIYFGLQKYGIILLILIVFTPIANYTLWPIITGLLKVEAGIFGILI